MDFQSLDRWRRSYKLAQLNLEQLRAEAQKIDVEADDMIRKEDLVVKLLEAYDERESGMPSVTETNGQQESAEERSRREPTGELDQNGLTSLLAAFLRREKEKLPLPKMTEKDEIGAFLKLYEMEAEVAELPRREWGKRLGRCLSATALEAYMQLDERRRENYEEVKIFLIQGVALTPETYRNKMVCSTPEFKETHIEWGRKILVWMNKWIQSTGKQISDLLLPELYLQMWKNDPGRKTLVDFVRSHAYDTFNEFLEMCDRYVAMAGPTKTFQKENQKKKGRDSRRFTPEQMAKWKKEGRCFNCSQHGHLTKDCPKKKSNKNGVGKETLLVGQENESKGSGHMKKEDTPEE